MIKQFVVGLLAVSLLAGCGEDKEKVAQEKIREAKAVYDNRPQGTLNEAGTRTLTADDINLCVTQMDYAKSILDLMLADYPSTKVAQSPEARKLDANLRAQLATCKQTKAQMSW